MTNNQFTFVEIRGERVVAIEGDGSDEIRSQFAREAEGLQARAYQIGLAIGMSAVSTSAVSHEGGGLAFRFAKSSAEKFDARGLIVQGAGCSASSLYEATK